MLKSLSVTTAFKAVPYLPTSMLMERHGGKLKFSSKKPNVIVGPNGAGKSALVTTLALRFLASQTGISSLDSQYTRGNDSDVLWTKLGGWGTDYAFMEGLDVATDNAPARYYRPGHIPGNEDSVTHAMMCGYFDEAKAFGMLTKDKSSGQSCRAMLDSVMPLLAGESLPTNYPLHNWSAGRDPLKARGQWIGPWEYQAEVLKAMFAKIDGGLPLILMDEPEQSLDALAELKLWKAIAEADASKMQIIVATHSLYPLLNPQKFNIIEAVDGYAAAVRALL